MIAIIGAKGSMGQRYRAILTFLGKKFIALDKEHSEGDIITMCRDADGVIVATPTATHEKFLRLLLPAKKPVLCEKPVTKNIKALKEITAQYRAEGVPFRMVFQYSMLVNPLTIGRSHYDYFRHGADGMVWDCMQIIALARGEVRLGETSPTWSCMINGRLLNLSDMDAAYIGYIQKWIKNPAQDVGQIVAAHEKTAELAKEGLING